MLQGKGVVIYLCLISFIPFHEFVQPRTQVNGVAFQSCESFLQPRDSLTDFLILLLGRDESIGKWRWLSISQWCVSTMGMEALLATVWYRTDFLQMRDYLRYVHDDLVCVLLSCGFETGKLTGSLYLAGVWQNKHERWNSDGSTPCAWKCAKDLIRYLKASPRKVLSLLLLLLLLIVTDEAVEISDAEGLIPAKPLLYGWFMIQT